jgi:hypothetical protein
MNRAQRRRARSQVKPRLIHYPEDFDPDRAQAILANSGAMDAVSENDREWFKANPDRSFHRPDDFTYNACAMLFAEAKEMSHPDFVKALEMMKEGM